MEPTPQGSTAGQHGMRPCQAGRVTHHQHAARRGWGARGMALLAGLVLAAVTVTASTRLPLHRTAVVQAAVGLAPVPTPAPQPVRALASSSAAMAASPTPTLVGSLVVLGDSVAAGSNCGCAPYATLLGQALSQRTGRPVPVVNEGVRGLTSARLLAQLSDGGVQRELKSAAVVTVTIGANDFDEDLAQQSACRVPDACYAATLEAMSAHLRAALSTIGALAPSGARVLVTGYWNVFLDGEVGRAQGATYVASSDALTRRVNTVVRAAAAASHASFVDEYAPFEGGSLESLTALLAPDGDHPSAAGHALIARLLLAAL